MQRVGAETLVRDYKPVREFRLTASSTSSLIFMATCLLAACARETGDAGSQGDQSERNSAVGWQVRSEGDPMTDATYALAQTAMSGELFDVQVSATCSDGGVSRYTFRVFNKEGQPEPFRVTETFGSCHFSMQVREDERRPYNHMEFRPAYSNQVQLRDQDATRAAAASRLTLRFFMQTGTDTMQLDQTDEVFRNAMAPCARRTSSTPNPSTARAPAPAPKDGTVVETPEGEQMTRPLRADEIEEIERSTGHPYRPGDAVAPEQ